MAIFLARSFAKLRERAAFELHPPRAGKIPAIRRRRWSFPPVRPQDADEISALRSKEAAENESFIVERKRLLSGAMVSSALIPFALTLSSPKGRRWAEDLVYKFLPLFFKR
jgi:hypothetical protein